MCSAKKKKIIAEIVIPSEPLTGDCNNEQDLYKVIIPFSLFVTVFATLRNSSNLTCQVPPPVLVIMQVPN